MGRRFLISLDPGVPGIQRPDRVGLSKPRRSGQTASIWLFR
jgi:hypothetical protein